MVPYKMYGSRNPWIIEDMIVSEFWKYPDI